MGFDVFTVWYPDDSLGGLYYCPWEALTHAAQVRGEVMLNGKTIWSATDGN
jgi:hypothetical protein